MTSDVVMAIADCVVAVAAVLGVIVAWWQLGNLIKTLKMTGLTVVLQLEVEMNSRKAKVDEIAAEIRRHEFGDLEHKDGLIGILSDQMEAYLENWLNAVERLAYCINRGYLSERDWKTEYRDYISGLVKTHPAKFQTGTIYTNIVDLHNKWQRE